MRAGRVADRVASRRLCVRSNGRLVITLRATGLPIIVALIFALSALGSPAATAAPQPQSPLASKFGSAADDRAGLHTGNITSGAATRTGHRAAAAASDALKQGMSKHPGLRASFPALNGPALLTGSELRDTAPGRPCLRQKTAAGLLVPSPPLGRTASRATRPAWRRKVWLSLIANTAW
jgi:hypothetical protein